MSQREAHRIRVYLNLTVDSNDKEEFKEAWNAFVKHVQDSDWWGTPHDIQRAWEFFLIGYQSKDDTNVHKTPVRNSDSDSF